MRPAKTMPTPMPTPAIPVANPRRSGGNCRAAMPGTGTQMIAPPSPMITSAMASTAGRVVNDASARPEVERTSPTFTRPTSDERDASQATTIVPRR